jgi:hypothetical protein
MKFVKIHGNILLLIALLSFSKSLYPQSSDTVYVDANTIKENTIVLDNVWRYHPGDDPLWASPNFNSANWAYWIDSLQVVVGIEYEIPVPLTYSLEQNYPNPFNPTTIITFGIPIKSQVALQVFNSIGELVALLVNEEKPTGSYEITWYAEQLPSGIYFYQLKAGNYIDTKKMVLMK